MRNSGTELLMGHVGSNLSPFKVNPSEQKYYDLYTNSPINKTSAILGDAAWETKKWYSDNYSSSQWANRGGYAGSISNSSGIFYNGVCGGHSDANCSSRTVLIP